MCNQWQWCHRELDVGSGESGLLDVGWESRGTVSSFTTDWLSLFICLFTSNPTPQMSFEFSWNCLHEKLLGFIKPSVFYCYVDHYFKVHCKCLGINNLQILLNNLTIFLIYLPWPIQNTSEGLFYHVKLFKKMSREFVSEFP